jgi:WD40 repeat protein
MSAAAIRGLARVDLGPGSRRAPTALGDRLRAAAWHRLIGHDTKVDGIEFSHDGSRMLSMSLDSTIRTWPAPQPDPQALCAKLTQNMSHADWNRWVSPDIRYQAACPGLPPVDDAR